MPVDDHPPTTHTCAECGHYEYRHGVHRRPTAGGAGPGFGRVYNPLLGTHVRGSHEALAYGYAAADEGVCSRYRPR